MARISLLILFLLTACADPGPSDPEPAQPDAPKEPAAEGGDVHSFARPDEVAMRHLDLDLDVDFESRRLIGRASIDLERTKGADRLWLDTHGLEIRGVTLGDGSEATWRLGDEVEFLGRPLEIELGPDTETVHVDYASAPNAGALQWLEPSQTAGGEHPFLLTQSQAIFARTWVPCQDSPAVRFTYGATVRVPEGVMAVMSAGGNPTERSADGAYRFDMPQAIPAYLLALAVGDLEFRAMGDRTGVYAEPPVVKAAAYEFAETEEMMVAVEALYGPYRWGRYDLLVLPSSFPFGGMENPRLTFLTPTVIAGDRSLVALIAHELAHSWSGNLVTNATWNDFWLNEGFTVYLERRIMEEIHDRGYADMLALLGRQDLDEQLADFGPGHADSHLLLDLDGRDPDDGMTDVAYEKGYFFLRSVEEAVVRERFDAFIRSWFEQGAFESRTTADFVTFFDKELIAGDEDLASRIDADAWIFGPGLPGGGPAVTSDRFERVDEARRAWAAGEVDASALDVEGWTTHEWLRFLRGLDKPVSAERLAELDTRFELTQSGNSEILHAWLLHAVASRYEAAYPAIEDFLTRQGRRKFLRPLYRAMAESGDLLPMAKEIYAKARPGYHSVSTGSVDTILDWQG
ncbi:MAG: M1 family metallopeptidase [Acidobacteriota bacterium]